MTRLTPLLTSLTVLEITYSKQETLLGTPETLPTSEPATPQIGYTVQDSDLPLITPTPYSVKYVALLFGAGRCPTAATIYYRMKKNGASVKTGNASVSANNYYTWNCYFYDVKVGDVLELALWSSVSDSNWDYKAFQIQPSRIIPMSKLRLLMPCDFASLADQPVLTLGNPSSTSYSLYVCHDDVPLSTTINAAKRYSCLYAGDLMGLFRLNYGDYNNMNNAVSRTSASYRPYYYRNYVPAQIKFRCVRID
ncbi:MAG: hypothetical protein QW160_03890 [Candidatus Bathyarchaeia archaeon]